MSNITSIIMDGNIPKQMKTYLLDKKPNLLDWPGQKHVVLIYVGNACGVTVDCSGLNW